MHIKQEHFWGVILAGGDGQRLRPFIREHLHSERPKQYCTFFGNQSLLRQTICRAERLLSPDHLLTVITQHHQLYAQDELADRPPGTVLVQPCNRDTGPGVLFPLWHIQQRDPEAVVVLLPSDHFVRDGQRFMEMVEAAAAFVERQPGRMVLLGVPPTQPEVDYGWIEVGQEIGKVGEEHLYQIRQFWEKPSLARAQMLLHQGYLWNTMVLVGQVSLFMTLYTLLTPALVEAFASFGMTQGDTWEEEGLEELYAALPEINFSYTILSQSTHRLAVLPLTEIYWSDWGDARRLLVDLDRFGYPLAVSQTHSTPRQAVIAS